MYYGKSILRCNHHSLCEKENKLLGFLLVFISAGDCRELYVFARFVFSNEAHLNCAQICKDLLSFLIAFNLTAV